MQMKTGVYRDYFMWFSKLRRLYDKGHDVSSGLHLVNPETVNGVSVFSESPSYVIYDSDRELLFFERIRF